MKVQDKIREQYTSYPYPPIHSGLAPSPDQWGRCLREIMDDLKGKSVLDVGCGTGWLTICLALLGMKVHGIDASPKSIDLARRLTKDLGVDATFEVADLFTYSPSNQFDLVVCTGVLHHTDRPFEGFQRLVSFTAEGGYVIVSLYSKYNLRFKIIDRLVRRKFTDISERLNYVKSHPRLFSFLTLTDVRKSKNEWLVDVFCNAHRSYHTAGEVKAWMKYCGIDYIGLARLWRIPFLGMINMVMHYFTVIGRKQGLAAN